MPAETYKEKLQETFPQGSVVEIIDPDNQLIMATILDYTLTGIFYACWGAGKRPLGYLPYDKASKIRRRILH
jgi:hypothetical protein